MTSNGKVVEYRTVLGNQPAELDKAVEKMLEKDWELYGNPFTDGEFHYQAMIRREPPKTKRVGALR